MAKYDKSWTSTSDQWVEWHSYSAEAMSGSLRKALAMQSKNTSATCDISRMERWSTLIPVEFAKHCVKKILHCAANLRLLSSVLIVEKVAERYVRIGT